MDEPADDVYIAAATASVRTEGVNDGYITGTARQEPFRAAVRAAYAAGRTAAAAEIRAEAKRAEEDGQGYSYAYGFADAANFIDPTA